METRKQMYARRRKERLRFGKVRTKCKSCGCYTKGKHKRWCRSEEASLIRGEILSKEKQKQEARHSSQA